MLRTVLLGLSAIAVVVLAGLARRLDRSVAKSPALELAAARLEQAPLTLGDWKGEDLEVSRRDMERTGAVGWVIRRYENRVTRQSVSILLVCAVPGPSRSTPRRLLRRKRVRDSGPAGPCIPWR
jgi:hypothetical protein